MTYRYSRLLAYSEFAAALAMVLFLYFATHPKWWGWLLFLPLFLAVVFEAVSTYRYSFTLDGDRITVTSFDPGQYRVSEITALNVWVAKGGHIAVIDFSDGRKLRVTSRLVGFDTLVKTLRTQAKLPEPVEG